MSLIYETSVFTFHVLWLISFQINPFFFSAKKFAHFPNQLFVFQQMTEKGNFFFLVFLRQTNNCFTTSIAFVFSHLQKKIMQNIWIL